MNVKVVLKGSEDRCYEVHCSAGLRHFFVEQIEKIHPGKRLFCIWDERVYKTWKDSSLGELENLTWRSSEERKNLSTVETLGRKLVKRGLDRGSVLIAVGGGVTGDVVGFLASIYMRGIPVVQIPTTLVAQVDSSVGGKTGVDLPEGKNLLGTFHQPSWVGIDPEFLTTLPDNFFYQGMAEVIKTAWLGDEELVEMLRNQHDQIKARQLKVLEEIVYKCVSVKARIVMADERESNVRRVLNLGHTFGHAVEQASNYSIPHGYAVAIGMRCAGLLSLELGKMSPEDFATLEWLLKIYNLPVQIPEELSITKILSGFYSDKKKRGSDLIFILPERPGRTSIYTTKDLKLVEKALKKAYPKFQSGK